MMRIRLPIGRTLLFLGVFFFSLLALLPLRLGLDWFGLGARGLAAREVQGTLWRGALRETQFGAVGVGDVNAGLHALPLLVGRARFAITRSDSSNGVDGFRGALLATRTSSGIADVTGPLMLTPAVLGRMPLGQVNLEGVTARFEDGQCTEASGTVRAAVAGDFGGVALPGGLSGPVRCDAGALLIALASQSSMESVEVRLFGDGRYTASALIRSTDTTLQPRMTAAGFTLTPQGYGMTVSGAL